MPDAIPKATLDAETDQALAMFRDKRRNAGRPYTRFADETAAQLRSQFPDVPGIGRIVMAVAQQIGCIDTAFREDLGITLPLISLLTIAGLAAEQLEREP